VCEHKEDMGKPMLVARKGRADRNRKQEKNIVEYACRLKKKPECGLVRGHCGEEGQLLGKTNTGTAEKRRIQETSFQNANSKGLP